LTRANHVRRMDMLLHRNQYENGQAVADLLGAGYHALAKARIALSRSDSAVQPAINAVPPSLIGDPGLMYERLVWRRKRDLDSGALEILNKAPAASQMYSPKDWWRERHILARRLIEKRQYQKAYHLVSSHRQTNGFPRVQAEWVSGFLALQFLDQPWKAFEHFEALYNNVETPISKARGAYWAGRASEALKHPQIAQEWYRVAAHYPDTYYGQLAAEKTPAIERIVFVRTPEIAIPDEERLHAARLFHRAGLKRESRLFLFKKLYEDESRNENLIVAKLASELGHQDIAIKAAQNIRNNEGVFYQEFLYPNISHALKNEHQVEWALIHAIIRQESRFDANAISPAGARGLMQLMPATARETAIRHSVSHRPEWLTSRPAHNITLGSRFLGMLLQRFDNNYAKAAAGYNAGPGRIPRWTENFGNPDQNQIDLVTWVELIPIYETRNYVQRVLEATHVYRQLLAHEQRPVTTPLHVAAAE